MAGYRVWLTFKIMAAPTIGYLASTDGNGSDYWGGGGSWGEVADSYKIGYIVIGCIGILGNAFVMIVMLTYTAMLKRLANYFILNQSIMDMTVGICLVATHSSSLAVDTYDFTVRGAELLCRIWKSEMLLWIAFMDSTYNMVVLTMERYLQIVHPIFHKSSFTRRKALSLIALVWLLGPAYNLALGIPTSAVENGYCSALGIWPSTVVQQAVGIIHVFVLFFIPLMLLAYLYGHMIYVIRRMARVGPAAAHAHAHKPESLQVPNAQAPARDSRSSRMSRAQRNLMKTVALVTMSFIVCWSCNQFFFLLSNSGYEMDFTSGFYHFSVIMVFLNCCINPFIYIFKYKEFQDGLQKVICKKSPKVHDSSNVHSTTQTAIKKY